MSRLFPVFLIAAVGCASVAATCRTATGEIAAERAIAIAQTHVTFEVASVNIEKVTEDGRGVWRVTFRGKPFSAEHPLLFPTLIVLVDRRSEEVISVAKT